MNKKNNANQSTMTYVTFEEVAGKVLERTKANKKLSLVAIDGVSGAGKSTLAKELFKILDSQLIEFDDFATVGSLSDWANITPAQRYDRSRDWARLRREVLLPILTGRTAHWRPFDWESLEGLSSKTYITYPEPIILLEGIHSSRPELVDLIDVTIQVTTSEENRIERLYRRENETYMDSWYKVWHESENYYFTEVRRNNDFDLIVETDYLF